MIKLYGFPISNFYNKVKLALLEKEIKFTEIRTAPDRKDPEYLKLVPTGRIPYLNHDNKIVFESTVMLDYIEESFPESLALLPSDPFERAQTRMVMNIIDLHIDPPARKLYGLLRDETIDDAILKKSLDLVQFGLNALDSLVNFKPYLCGDIFTMADCAAVGTLPLVDEICAKLELEPMLDKITGYREYFQQMQERPHVKKVLRGAKAARRGLQMSKND